MRLLLKLSCLIFLVLVPAALAAPTNVLVWGDLVPKFKEDLKSPFEELELYRQLEFETIQWAALAH